MPKAAKRPAPRQRPEAAPAGQRPAAPRGAAGAAHVTLPTKAQPQAKGRATQGTLTGKATLPTATAGVAAPRQLRRLTTLQTAFVVSLLVHLLLLAVRIVDPEGFNRILEDTPLEVVLVNSSTSEAPTKAQVIAQRNLAGGGNTADERATSPLPPSPVTEAGDAVEDSRRRIDDMQAQQMQLLTVLRRELASLPPSDTRQDNSRPAAQADEERRRQLLRLLAQIEKRINEENARPRRKFVSPSAREGVHAIYYDSLRQRIEELGTHNFPEAGGKKLYGELTMLVAVDALGRVVETEIVRGSGNRVLDKRATAIVKGAAPYGPFTPAMRTQFDQLVFVSRFRFSRDEGLRATLQDASSPSSPR